MAGKLYQGPEIQRGAAMMLKESEAFLAEMPRSVRRGTGVGEARAGRAVARRARRGVKATILAAVGWFFGGLK